MRISDWSSDVCSSDLVIFAHAPDLESGQAYYADVKARASGFGRDPGQLFVMPGIAPLVGDTDEEDRKSVVSGKSVSVRVDLGGRRIIKKKITYKTITNTDSIVDSTE